MGRDEDEPRGTGATPAGASAGAGAEPTGVTRAAAPGERTKPHGRGRHRRVVRAGTEQSTVDGVSSDELPVGWSDPASEDRSRDAELRRDVPPHWS